MARKPFYDWYLKEHLDARDTTVTWLEEQTGWTHRIASQLVNRKIRWNRDHLSQAARVMQVEPFELLLHPDEANHIRRLRHAAEEEYRLKLVAEQRAAYRAEAPEGDRLIPRRKIG